MVTQGTKAWASMCNCSGLYCTELNQDLTHCSARGAGKTTTKIVKSPPWHPTYPQGVVARWGMTLIGALYQNRNFMYHLMFGISNHSWLYSHLCLTSRRLLRTSHQLKSLHHGCFYGSESSDSYKYQQATHITFSNSADKINYKVRSRS